MKMLLPRVRPRRIQMDSNGKLGWAGLSWAGLGCARVPCSPVEPPPAIPETQIQETGHVLLVQRI